MREQKGGYLKNGFIFSAQLSFAQIYLHARINQHSFERTIEGALNQKRRRGKVVCCVQFENTLKYEMNVCRGICKGCQICWISTLENKSVRLHDFHSFYCISEVSDFQDSPIVLWCLLIWAIKSLINECGIFAIIFEKCLIITWRYAVNCWWVSWLRTL